MAVKPIRVIGVPVDNVGRVNAASGPLGRLEFNQELKYNATFL
jgi:hypothetical protein